VTSTAAPAPFTGPFAIGTLSAPRGARFPGLVAPDGRVLDLSTAPGDPTLTTRVVQGAKSIPIPPARRGQQAQP
jgi:hypothetical protein